MPRKRVLLTVLTAVAAVTATWLTIPKMVANAAPPVDQVRAAADVECTLAGTAKSDKGITNGASVNTGLAVSPTSASCLDRRTDVQNKLIGATVDVPNKGTLNGNCTNLTGTATVRVTWLRATPTATPAVSTIVITAGVQNGVPSGSAEVIDGPLKGYTVSALPVSVEALNATKDLLLAACATSGGASQGSVAGTVYFTKPA